MKQAERQTVGMEDIVKAHHVLSEVVVRTPLQLDATLSLRYGCNVYLKREDLQVVRSFKIRGAYNMIRSLQPEDLQRGIVCASAGNHAQGVAFPATRWESGAKFLCQARRQTRKLSR
ncbi:hypothetical protein HMSSN036_17260 [Paenibacillus macerans]|nr:hypothetical protein HMSSN036_17260 [Paenibacillus macerans]